MDRIRERLEVATCIACGARSRAGECAGGCADVALDLVEAHAVDELGRRLVALEERSEALRAVTRRLAAASGDESWEVLAAAARAALRIAVPAVEAQPEIVAAWGCPRCGRIDAPQPCLGVCVRLPVAMVDAGEYRHTLRAAEGVDAVDRVLTPVATLAGHIRARPGKEGQTRDVVRRHARAALDEVSRAVPAS